MFRRTRMLVATALLGGLAAVPLTGESTAHASASQPVARAVDRPSTARARHVPHAHVGFATGESVRTRHGVVTAPSRATYWRPADRSALTPAVWRVLARHHTPLFLNLREGRDFGPHRGHPHRATDAAAVVRRANRFGVPVDAWLVLPFSKGYWSYQGNGEATRRAVMEWYRWMRSHRLRFRDLVIDLELSSAGWQRFAAAIGNPVKALPFMASNVDPARQCRAITTYRRTLHWAHDRGLRVIGTTEPFAIDDLADGRVALQDALGMVAFPPDDYDRYDVQAYRGYVEASIGVDPGSAYVASYQREISHDFGQRGEVDLGIVGEPPYDVIGPVVSDVRMLAGMGARLIPIFSLDATVSSFGVSGLRRVIGAAGRPLTGAALTRAERPTPQSLAAQHAFNVLDALAVAATLGTTTAKGAPALPNPAHGPC